MGDSNLFQRVVRIEPIDRYGALLVGTRFKIYVNNEFQSGTKGEMWFTTVQLEQPDVDLKAEAFYKSYRHEGRADRNANVLQIEFPEVKYMPENQANNRFIEIAAFCCGIAFLLLTIVLAIYIPDPTKFQSRVFTGFFPLTWEHLLWVLLVCYQ